MNLKTRELTQISLLTGLIALCSWIVIPGPIPFTMQTFAIFFGLSFLKGTKGIYLVWLYLLSGVIGLPVFSGFAAGPGQLLGPTAGYLWGFLLAAYIYRYLGNAKSFNERFLLYICLLACYILGSLWFYFYQGGAFGFKKVLSLTLLPFIIPDLIKIELALKLAKRFNT